jgi:hypothetical protein
MVLMGEKLPPGSVTALAGPQCLYQLFLETSAARCAVMSAAGSLYKRHCGMCAYR